MLKFQIWKYKILQLDRRVKSAACINAIFPTLKEKVQRCTLTRIASTGIFGPIVKISISGQAFSLIGNKVHVVTCLLGPQGNCICIRSAAVWSFTSNFTLRIYSNFATRPKHRFGTDGKMCPDMGHMTWENIINVKVSCTVLVILYVILQWLVQHPQLL